VREKHYSLVWYILNNVIHLLNKPAQETNYKLVLIWLTVKVYKDHISNEVTSKTVLQWSAGETQKDFTGFWVKIFNGERPPKQLVTLHNKKLSVRQVIEGPENMAPIQNDQPHDGEKFGFKPFGLSVAGTYVLKYIAMLGDREMAVTKFDILIKGTSIAQGSGMGKYSLTWPMSCPTVGLEKCFPSG